MSKPKKGFKDEKRKNNLIEFNDMFKYDRSSDSCLNNCHNEAHYYKKRKFRNLGDWTYYCWDHAQEILRIYNHGWSLEDFKDCGINDDYCEYNECKNLLEYIISDKGNDNAIFKDFRKNEWFCKYHMKKLLNEIGIDDSFEDLIHNYGWLERDDDLCYKKGCNNRWKYSFTNSMENQYGDLFSKLGFGKDKDQMSQPQYCETHIQYLIRMLNTNNK